MKILHIAFSAFILCSQIAIGQDNNIHLEGRLIDEGNQKPIEYASIVVAGTSTGSACNDEGIFALSIPHKFASYRIRISCIGYMSRSFSIDSLSKVGNLVLALSPDKTILDEITIASTISGPAEILDEALNSIPRNYCRQPFNLDLYSTITNYDSIRKSSYKLETILLGYYEGYFPNASKKFKILEKRENGIDPLESVDYTYWPSNELYSVDLITDQASRGIFNRENWDKFRFERQDISIYDDDTVFVITYDLPKPTTKITGYGITPNYYRGRIFIAHRNYAIVRHTLETSSFTYDIIYKKIDKYYFPYLIRGDRENIFKLGGKRRSFRNTNLIIVKDIRLTDIEKIDPKEDEWHVTKIKYNKTYWDLNHPAN